MGGHCPGSHNVKCCPVGQVDRGEVEVPVEKKEKKKMLNEAVDPNYTPLPETITNKDGIWLKKFVISMRSLALGFWAEPNKLPKEYNFVKKEWLPVFQGEEMIHCMWKKQRCGYCN